MNVFNTVHSGLIDQTQVAQYSVNRFIQEINPPWAIGLKKLQPPGGHDIENIGELRSFNERTCSLEDQSLIILQAKLDEFYTWPSTYMFKFIAPVGQVNELTALFRGRPFTTRLSRTAKYVSITAEWEVGSSEEVISFYREAKKIDGVIAL